MVLNNKIRELLFTQQKNNYYTNDLKSISKPLDELIGINNMCSKNMEIILNKTIKLKKRGSKKKEMIIEKVENDTIPDYVSDSSDEEPVNDMEIVEPVDETILISRDISGDDINSNIDDITVESDTQSNKEEEEESKEEVESKEEEEVESKEEESKESDTKSSKEEESKESDTKSSKEEESKESDIQSIKEIDGGNNIDNLLFQSLNNIHKKGGSTPNLTQNFNNDAVGGRMNNNNNNTKTIKLTEQYNFF
jgi:hypothetical protein